jgi:4-aminobutyrate aminotransferase/(S)-3-amino-2-methylpropionate transaminase
VRDKEVDRCLCPRSRKKIVANGVGVFNTATVEDKRGAIIIDADGRELIDFAGGIRGKRRTLSRTCGSNNKRTSRKIFAYKFNVVTYDHTLSCVRNWLKFFPMERLKAMLTGAEAVENAIKSPRQATKRPAVLCYTGAYHGRTMMAMTLTSKTAYNPIVVRLLQKCIDFFPIFTIIGSSKRDYLCKGRTQTTA